MKAVGFEPRRARALLAGLLFAACGAQEAPAPAPVRVVEPAIDEPAADTVYRNGRIYTVDRRRPWVSAVAIKDGFFIGVGANGELEALVGPETQVVDLAGRMAMPGIFDLHVHPFTTATFHVMDLSFSDPSSPEAMLTELREFAEAHPEKSWIRGGPWGIGVFPADAPRKELLDEVVPDRPVALIDETGQSYWLNSKALDLAGLSQETPDLPPVVVRDPATGAPSGTVRDMALRRIEAVAEKPTPETFDPALQTVFDEFASQGVTSIQTAEGNFRNLDAVQRLDRGGRLPVRLFVAWDWYTQTKTAFTNQELDFQIVERVKYESDLVSPNYVMILADGPLAAGKAFMLEPYLDGSGEEGDGSEEKGELRLDPAELREAVVDFDRRGIGTVIHAEGDGAVRAALDAVEAARRETGDTDVRHKVAQATWVSPEDVARLGGIPGVSVEISPEATVPAKRVVARVERLLGAERVQAMGPVRSLLRARAFVGYGSGGPNPSAWRALQGLVTRRNPDAPELGELGPKQSISLEQGLQILTLAGAYAVGEEDDLGSIEVGKLADMIVLDRNLFEIPVEEIGGTRVLRTILGGRKVFDRLAE